MRMSRPIRNGYSSERAKLRRMPVVGSLPDHRLAERRSLAYHAEIATRVAADCALLARARLRVEEWLRSGAVARFYAQAWYDVLAQTLPEIQRLLCDPGEHMSALRQVSPFAGALPPKDRWRLWRAERIAS